MLSLNEGGGKLLFGFSRFRKRREAVRVRAQWMMGIPNAGLRWQIGIRVGWTSLEGGDAKGGRNAVYLIKEITTRFPAVPNGLSSLFTV
jgi:hypothetical protein